MDIKLIAIDFDGTFLDDNHFKDNLDYVDKIRKANISQELVFASGRATSGIVSLIKKLKMEDMIRYIIGHNGAEIYDLKENKYIYQAEIDREISLDLIKFLLENKIKNPIAIHKWDKLHIYNYDERVDLELNVNFSTKVLIDNIDNFPEKIMKIMIFATGIEVDNIYNLIKNSKFNQFLTQARSINFLVELTKKDITKASALKILCDKLNISMNNVLAFGNAENDIEMIVNSGLGYAMKNSDEILIKKAKNITKYTNNENGVERTIIEILNI